MKIIITAAGLGSRFKNVGINKPKFEIIVNGKTLFYWSIISLKKFFDEEFIFIFRKSNYSQKFISNELKKLKIKKYKIVLLSHKTHGQADTVMMARKYIKPNDSLLIYNIDTHVDPNKININWFRYDGLIVTSINHKGNHWSFAKTDNKSFATQVTEKVRISNHTSIGLYYFSKFSDFVSVFDKFNKAIVRKYKEIYVCPMYQYMIEKGKKIFVRDVPLNSVICLGTPEEIKKVDRFFIKNNA